VLSAGAALSVEGAPVSAAVSFGVLLLPQPENTESSTIKESTAIKILVRMNIPPQIIIHHRQIQRTFYYQELLRFPPIRRRLPGSAAPAGFRIT
jgi:hypothetical protein